MKKIVNYFGLMIVAAVMTAMSISLTSCAKGNQRTQIIKAVDDMKSQLPMQINSFMSMTEVNLDTDNWIIEYQFSVPDGIIDLSADDDEATAIQMVKALTQDDKMRKAIEEAEVGFKITLNGETLSKTYDVPFERIAALSDKLDKGEVEALGFIDTLRKDLAATQFPVDLGNGVQMVNAEIDDNHVVYSYTVDGLEGTVDDPALSSEIKNDLLKDLKPFVKNFKDEIFSNNITVTYNYYNVDGEVAFSVVITPSDMF